MMAPTKRVAIIGAGPSGLTAIKACKEEGFEPVCFERNGDPGGLWRYHAEDIEGVPSVMKTTIINTSKEMSAFSDFPPPKEYPNFMHNTLMYKYFMMYAENFDLLRHIRYYMKVVKVEPTDDFNKTGRWKVTAEDSKSVTVTEEFDAVMVCVGHHVFPKIPTFPGQEKFRGSITHTHSLKTCERYTDQRVVVVGIGNSGVDAAVDSAFVAKNVYLSTRRGSWIFARLGSNGLPYDFDIFTRRHYYKAAFKSYDKLCGDLEKELDKKFDHTAYCLKPKHRIYSAHPSMNDALPNCILSGKVIVKGDIKKFEENGVVFEGEDQVTEVEAVILATGYHIRFPFLDKNLVKTDDNRIHLYKYVIPPHLQHPTLALVGLVQPLGAIFPVAEMQCRWFMQILSHKFKLPSITSMAKDIECKNKANAIRYVDSTRHTIQIDFIPYMDEISTLVGAKPNLLKLAVTDPKLFWVCLTSPCYPYQYRLQGPHAWAGARNALMGARERVLSPLKTKCIQVDVSKKSIGKHFLFTTVLITAFAVAASRYVDHTKLSLSSYFH